MYFIRKKIYEGKTFEQGNNFIKGNSLLDSLF